MKYKHYSPEVWKQIEATLEQVLKQDPHPIAAFDADGTLWDMDLGENFFQFQIDNNSVPLPKNAFLHYEEMKKQNNDPRAAYLWLAAINKDKELAEVQKWAHEAVQHAKPIPVFDEQQKLIELFLKKGVHVYVVTASIKWAVEPGALEFYQLPFEQVIGVQTKVLDGKVTDIQEGIVSYRQGKVEALLEATQGKKPFFCSGNTMGDFELLSAATHLSLAVSAANQDDKLYRTERELQTHAQQKGWLHHRFI